ncbi:MAG TPA: AAA family ATPase [Planctomycetaceae bacterium]|jgi:type II secretory pathway predicted ATPase ExeA|nr:AAA family ATPase [Planctomycetaceae bacterium]
MYSQHFGLTETPFANTLDPHWFYQSPGHEEALARLMYLIEERRRCGVLLGPAGTGKSLLLQVLLAETRRLPREVVLVDLLGRTGRELLWETNAALGLGPRGDETSRLLWRMLGDHLATNCYVHTPTVICFDHVDRAEADCLTALERLYHTATVETGVTLIVSARPQRLSKLAQTLSAMADLHVELPALDRDQTEAYVETLLTAAGATRMIFEPACYDRIFTETRGVPRDINRLCDLSLVAGLAEGAARITESIVMATIEQLHPLRIRPPVFQTRRRTMAEI